MSDSAPAVDPPNTARPKRKGEHRIWILEMKAALASFASILPPVFLTMLLSASIVLYVTPDIAENVPESPIIAFNEDEADSGGEAASIGVLNALIIVGGITVMTFVIVLLIYLKCEKIFAGYLVFALILIMGFTTSTMVLEGLETYSVPTDVITFVLFFYNYAVTGALAIFSFEGGFQGPVRLIPYSITQFYLVLVSVVMAWLVTTLFPEFTVWGLLVALAFYDLCAVLTPCGPLNCLLKVVTKRQEEAEEEAIARGENPEDNAQKQMIPGLLYEVRTGTSTGMKKFRKKKQPNTGAAGALNFSVMMAFHALKDGEDEDGEGDPQEEPEEKEEDTPETAAAEDEEGEQQPEITQPTEVIDEPEAKPKEKITLTDAEREQRYQQLLKRRERLEAELLEELKQQSNLKLGLGDFVFYSVLTAKAAEFGFIAFVSVATCVLCGLCGTLILLSVFQKALPALPISIFLGVITYLVVFALVSPFSDGIVLNLATV